MQQVGIINQNAGKLEHNLFIDWHSCTQEVFWRVGAWWQPGGERWGIACTVWSTGVSIIPGKSLILWSPYLYNFHIKCSIDTPAWSPQRKGLSLLTPSRCMLSLSTEDSTFSKLSVYCSLVFGLTLTLTLSCICNANADPSTDNCRLGNMKL